MFRNWTRKDVFRISGLIVLLLSAVIPIVVALINNGRLFPPTPTKVAPQKSIKYSVLITYPDNGSPVPNARVSVNIPGNPTLHKFTGNDGYVEFVLGREYLGETATITVQKEGYLIKNLSEPLVEGSPSVVIQLSK